MTPNAIRDWCRFLRTGAVFIKPSSPWANTSVESFGGKLRDGLLAVELFTA